ncbi:hypothetical protein JVX92_00740 [Microbacterium hominis]|uniref:hypothetical protein n=1 Tax=Microbacterium hominis TaxID=162426 RepID=UPI00196570BE|nr:hypothetical protein [Microbacterium hominis]QRY40855.1 hypothetical protein JVX92_00740 [Microbacterium hominis]
MTTFVKAVATFKKSAKSWLTDEDSPAVAALEAAARQLDAEMSPALLSAYGLTYRNLLKRKPADPNESGDELDDLIPGD